MNPATSVASLPPAGEGYVLRPWRGDDLQRISLRRDADLTALVPLEDADDLRERVDAT